jgi:site-specific recombinase XerD
MSKLGNIVQLNAKADKENKNVYATILTFLTRKGQNSVNTQKTYERHIRDFFGTMRNKRLEDLVEEDLFFTPQQIETYQVALKERYKGTTVNGTMSAIRECYGSLSRNGFAVEKKWFDLDAYDEHDKESYDTLTHEEVCNIIDLVSKTRKGSEKSLLVRLAYATAFRKESLISLKWSSIIDREGVWYIKTLGKGNKWSHKKLSKDLYEALMAHKLTTNKEKIFELTKKTINKMMNYIRENMDFGDRRIVFHSFKKASINEVNIISGGDIKAMQAHGDHNDATTTLNDYLAKKNMEDLVMVDINTHIPVEKFEELSQEELVGLLKSMDRNTQIRLLKKIGSM